MTTLRFTTLAAWLLSFFAAPLVGTAGIIVNEDATWPTAPVVETFEPTDDNVTSERDARHTRDLTQTFQVTQSFQVDKLFIDVEEAVADREYTIRLFTVDDVNAASLIDPDNVGFTGSVVFSHVLMTSAGINTGEGGNNPFLVLEFDLTDADEVTLPANVGTAGYAFQILRTGEGSGRDGADPAGDSRAFKWHYNNRGSTTLPADTIYPPGRGYALTGGGIDQGDDFLLAILAVPEPGTMALGLLAGVAVVAVRRRRLP